MRTIDLTREKIDRTRALILRLDSLPKTNSIGNSRLTATPAFDD